MWIVLVLFTDRDNKTCSAGQYLFYKQIMKVAKTLGSKWEQAALHLGLKNEDLDKIKKENNFMQRQNMLKLWKDRRPGKCTVQYLLSSLEDMEDLPVQTLLLLKGNVLHPDTV